MFDGISTTRRRVTRREAEIRSLARAGPQQCGLKQSSADPKDVLVEDWFQAERRTGMAISVRRAPKPSVLAGAAQGIQRFVAAHKVTDEARQESEERFRRLAEMTPDVIYRVRLLPELAIEFVSSAVEVLSGYVPGDYYADPGLSWRLLQHDDRKLLEESLRSPTTDPVVLSWRHKNGETIWGEMQSVPIRDESGEVVALEGIIRDTTQQKKLEAEYSLLKAEFLGAQKMAAVGTFAGGVAHNFNNLLTAISGYSELVLARLPDDSDLRADVQEIKLAAVRAAEVTHGLLAFSRREAGESTTLDLNEIVSGMEALLEQLIGGNIDNVSVLMPGLAPIEGDRSRIEQMIVNMALNARDAMPTGGKLVIETANLDLAEPLIASGISLDAGRYVTLTICDTGSGMDGETLARVFEPFFSTKGPDRGTGLGLSSALGIAETAGGRISVSSRLGEGTTFTLYLPASDSSAS